MRSLWISILSLALILGIFGVFQVKSERELARMTAQCQGAIMDAVESEDWTTASGSFGREYQRWQDYRKTALFFLDTDAINQADQAFAKTLKYIKAEDVSNSSGELLALSRQLAALHQNESVTLQNIF